MTVLCAHEPYRLECSRGTSRLARQIKPDIALRDCVGFGRPVSGCA